MFLTRVDVNYSDDLSLNVDVVSSDGASGFAPSSSAEEALMSNYPIVDSSSSQPHEENLDPSLFDFIGHPLSLNFADR